MFDNMNLNINSNILSLNQRRKILPLCFYFTTDHRKINVVLLLFFQNLYCSKIIKPNVMDVT